MDDPGQAKRLIDQVEKPLMIAGYLPHSGQMDSVVLLGDIETEIIRFKMGGVVRLNESDSKWLINWAFVPEFIQK